MLVGKNHGSITSLNCRRERELVAKPSVYSSVNKYVWTMSQGEELVKSQQQPHKNKTGKF